MKQLIAHHKKKRQDLSSLYKREMRLTVIAEKHRHDERIRKIKLAGKVGGGFVLGGLMGFGMGSMATGTLYAFGVTTGTAGITPTGVGAMSLMGARESYKQHPKLHQHAPLKKLGKHPKTTALVIGTPEWKKYQAKTKTR